LKRAKWGARKGKVRGKQGARRNCVKLPSGGVSERAIPEKGFAIIARVSGRTLQGEKKKIGGRFFSEFPAGKTKVKTGWRKGLILPGRVGLLRGFTAGKSAKMLVGESEKGGDRDWEEAS